MRLCEYIIDAAGHEKSLLGNGVALAVKDHFETSNCFLDWHKAARNAGELFRHKKRLAEKPLHLARSGDNEFVFGGKFVHAEYGDNILQFLVSLQNLPGAQGSVIMFFANYVRVKNAGTGSQRIHRWVNAQLNNFAGERGGCVQMGKGGSRSGIGQIVRRHIHGLDAGNRTF